MPKISNSQNLVTKNFLEEKLDRLENKINDKLTKFKDTILTAIDPLLQELEQRREDREIATYQTEQIRDQLSNHEKRIKKIEAQKTI